MSWLKTFVDSAKELKRVHSLAAIAMLLALRVVLGIFANTSLPMFGNTVKISLAFLPIALTGAVFGPIPAALVGALGDIVSFMIMPMGAYSPGFTISGLLTGLIYGFALYKNQITIQRVIIGWMVNMLVVETFLAAYWLYIFPPNLPYAPTLISRFISVAVKCIPEILIIFGVGKLVARLDKRLLKS
jgi:ECF transporter S component (folate family)